MILRIKRSHLSWLFRNKILLRSVEKFNNRFGRMLNNGGSPRIFHSEWHFWMFNRKIQRVPSTIRHRIFLDAFSHLSRNILSRGFHSREISSCNKGKEGGRVSHSRRHFVWLQDETWNADERENKVFPISIKFLDGAYWHSGGVETGRSYTSARRWWEVIYAGAL